jgi:hypothetical protein
MADGSVGAVMSTAELRARDTLDEYERTRHSFIYEGVELGFVRATRATEQRLRPDPISRLLANETITKDQARAGVEIRTIYESIVSSMLARSGNAERVARGAGGMPEYIATIHATRYLPWAYYLGGRPHCGRERLPVGGESRYAKIGGHGRCRLALEIAIAVIVEGASIAEVDASMGWGKHSKASKYIRYTLALYSDIAGWEQNRDEIADFEMTFGRRKAA